MEARDAEAIAKLARRQCEAGASYIDVNAGMFLDDEPDVLEWLVGVVAEAVGAPLSIDTPNAAALKRGLAANAEKGHGKPIVNSITGEKARFEAVLPLVLEYGASVIALCMDDSGMPDTVEDRLRVAGSLIENLANAGVAEEDIFIDPMVRPVGTGPHYGVVAIETIREVKRRYPHAHSACGLSNVSFGIPARKLMNQAFLVAAMSAGMDGAILDPLDKKLMSILYATEALLGIDEYCMEYITKYRDGALEL
jgi:5-methyltetrahydrofolate--homocysteine methyltransferase